MSLLWISPGALTFMATGKPISAAADTAAELLATTCDFGTEMPAARNSSFAECSAMY